jgi:hypothetical protein
MKTDGQGNFLWMVGGGKRRKKKHRQTIFVDDRLQRSCTSEKAFPFILPSHIPRRQHELYVCAFSSPGKHCTAHWGASELGHGVRKKPPVVGLSGGGFSSFCPLWSLVLQPTSPQQPKRLIKVYIFSLLYNFH